MRSIDKENITQAFMDYSGPETSPRLRFILEKMVSHLHDFTRETGLTHEEWRTGLELLYKAGSISDEERNEFVLFSDVLGFSSLVDLQNSPDGATPSSVLGPFHVLGAPDLPVGGDLKRDNEGMTVVVEGRVLSSDGSSIPGAELEIWQTADNGLYSNQDPAQADYNFRAHMVAGQKGEYLFSTVRPSPYSVPDDGPVGELLKATGRHPWRPSHFHFIVTAPGFQTLVTEVFPSDDPYLDEDAVFGVRDELVANYVVKDDRGDIPQGLAIAETMELPFLKVDFDMVLAPEIQST